MNETLLSELYSGSLRVAGQRRYVSSDRLPCSVPLLSSPLLSAPLLSALLGAEIFLLSFCCAAHCVTSTLVIDNLLLPCVILGVYVCVCMRAVYVNLCV